MRVRPEHWSLLLDISERNKEIITNKFNGPEGKTRGNALWQNIANELNSLGFGEKSKEEWRRVRASNIHNIYTNIHCSMFL